MIKKKLFNREKMISILVVVSILMFCSLLYSLFTSNAKIAAIGLTLWIITVFWNVYLMLNANNINLESIFLEIDKKYEIAKHNKKYIEQFLYGITIPMIGIGLIMIVLILITLFTMI